MTLLSCQGRLYPTHSGVNMSHLYGIDFDRLCSLLGHLVGVTGLGFMCMMVIGKGIGKKKTRDSVFDTTCFVSVKSQCIVIAWKRGEKNEYADGACGQGRGSS